MHNGNIAYYCLLWPAKGEKKENFRGGGITKKDKINNRQINIA